ncbi:AraC family transcriptional regulator [Citreimonas salinaria]|nr:AraC family transcriptional regulator [Citreimonas salinaria]
MMQGQSGPAEFLQAHPILRTESLSEAREVVGRAFCDHRLNLRRRGAKLAARHNHVGGRHVSLNALGYGTEVEIDPGQLGHFYLLQIPLSGGACVSHRGEEVVASPRLATILSPDRETRMVWSEDCRKLLLQIDRQHLERVAEELLGSPLPGPVRFDPAVDLETPQGRALRNRVLAVVRAVDGGELWAGPQGLRESRAERDVVASLLTLHGSNISHAFWRSERPMLPRDLRRAVAFIHAHFADPLRLDTIAAHCGLSPRALQIGFRKAFDLTPMEYLRQVRLDSAHYRLSRRRDPEGVGDVAHACGFSHLGRFARDYRARFGDSPVRRRRRAQES